MLRFSSLLSLTLTALLSTSALPALAVENYTAAYTDPSSSYILVFAYPSAAWLDWSAPSKLARTSVQSTVAQRLFGLPSTIGHAQFAWHCRRPDGSLVRSGASGQSGENHGQSIDALKNGWGMSLLEFVYNDGHLESPAEVAQRIHKGARGNQFSWAGFKVPVENCLALADYVKDYEASGNYVNYGFPVDPIKLEGGGCTSYANAALEKSGVPIPWRRFWVRDYLIPENQLGRAQVLPSHTALVPAARVPERPLHVPLSDFLVGERNWASADEPAIRFEYYDPELFYESFLQLENHYRAHQNLPLKSHRRTAQEDVFQDRLSSATEAWMQQLDAAKTPMEMGKIAGYTGLVIDLRTVSAK